MENERRSKAAVIGMLLGVDIGNPNAGWTEGIVTVMKKVEKPDGKTYPYISGQALRRYLRDTMRDMEEAKDRFSPLKETQDPKAPILTEGNPKKWIDDDIFGFMRATKEETKKRESPLRVAPAVGQYPYTGDRDLGTLTKTEAADKFPSMYETEITSNVYRTTWLLELDRVGRWKEYEISGKEKAGELSPDERRERATLPFKALKYLWGGGRRTRLLVDITPQFLIYARMDKKVPIFLNNLTTTYRGGGNQLDVERLQQILKEYEENVLRLILGVRKGFLANEDGLARLSFREEAVKVQTVSDALDEIEHDLSKAEF